MDLPVLDFSKFTHGNPSERVDLAKALAASFRDHGFIKLVNHGLPETTVTNYLQAAKDFFNLPPETKNRIANVKGPKPQRGFSWMGAEQTSKLRPENIGNHKTWTGLNDAREHFDAGPPGDSEFPNKWPSEDEFPGFQELMESCYIVFQQICLDIMEAMEVGLELPKNTLVDRCVPASSELRHNHYPATDLSLLTRGKVKRTWPHTDFGIVTLLFQDGIGGLEMENRADPGTFVPVVSPKEGCGKSEMIVNISDTFQRWTNGVIRAGLHQVTLPQQMKGATEGVCPERYSGIFFFKAHRAKSAGPLPQFVTLDYPALYDEITALQYQQRKTAELY